MSDGMQWFWGALFLGLLLESSSSQTYKLCVLPQTPSYHSPNPICKKLDPTPVRCVIGVDRLDCKQKVNNGEADFAVLEAEDLLTVPDNSDILVTHRIHASEDKNWEFAVVALVSNKANVSSIADLKSKRLCHPGYDPFSTAYDWNEMFSLYFENRVAPKVCDKGVSVEENRVKALAEFFGESCRPGAWAADPEVDSQLKRKYASMCAECGVPSMCSQTDEYWGRQGALSCLSDCRGDVAWSMLKDAKLHFKNEDVKVSECSDVSLLCPNGKTMPLNSREPCIWLARPVPVIVAKRSKAEDIQNMLEQVLRPMPDTPDGFIRLLESTANTPPKPLNPSITPHDYLESVVGFLSAESVSRCGQGDRAVTLCTTTLQDKSKCDLLARVSRAYGLEPSLSCVQYDHCLTSVASKSADATIADSDKLLTAIRDLKLKPLLLQTPALLKLSRSVSAVVKSSSNLNKISDLKGKKACFSSVDGMGWSTFTMSMLKEGWFTEVCPHTQAMSQFFSEICVSETSSSTSHYSNITPCLPESGSEDFDKTLADEIYDNEALAFKRLAIGKCDVAFISAEAIPKYWNDIKSNPNVDGLTEDSFITICEKNSTDKNCPLGWSALSHVLVHETVSSSKEEDILSLFTGINNLFGHFPPSPSTRTFNMFDASNSLFNSPVGSEPIKQSLQRFDVFKKKAGRRTKNYEASVDSLKTCSTSHASRSKQAFPCLLALGLLFYFTVLTNANSNEKY